MHPFLKVFLLLAAIFASTFLILNTLGWLTVDNVKHQLTIAHDHSLGILIALVILLLFADLFIAVPTMTICILSGYYLGFYAGSLASMTGMMLAELTGYGINRFYSSRWLKFIIKPNQLTGIKSVFDKQGFVMILLSRAPPILPEVSACLAGVSKMPAHHFLAAWSLNTIPYALISSYSGSISSISNPKPAVLTMIGKGSSMNKFQTQAQILILQQGKCCSNAYCLAKTFDVVARSIAASRRASLCAFIFFVATFIKAMSINYKSRLESKRAKTC